MPRSWASPAIRSTVTPPGRSRSAGSRTRLLSDIHRDVVKRYGIHWPELNACHRATFVIDGQGLVRFVERYGRGVLPDPARILAEVKKLD